MTSLLAALLRLALYPIAGFQKQMRKLQFSLHYGIVSFGMRPQDIRIGLKKYEFITNEATSENTKVAFSIFALGPLPSTL